MYWFSVKMTARLEVNATPGRQEVPSHPRDRIMVLGRSLVLIACGREGTEWASWDQSVHAAHTLLSRGASRACSSFRSRSDQISVALPSIKSGGAR